MVLERSRRAVGESPGRLKGTVPPASGDRDPPPRAAVYPVLA